MGGLREFLPAHAWAAVLGLAAVAMLAFFIPPSVGAAVGLTGTGFLAAVAAVELLAALGMAVVFIRYRADGGWEEDDTEWRYDP
jgi:hypothetical protein